jgi:hypothetical protein
MDSNTTHSSCASGRYMINSVLPATGTFVGASVYYIGRREPAESALPDLTGQPRARAVPTAFIPTASQSFAP